MFTVTDVEAVCEATRTIKKFLTDLDQSVGGNIGSLVIYEDDVYFSDSDGNEILLDTDFPGAMAVELAEVLLVISGEIYKGADLDTKAKLRKLQADCAKLIDGQ